METRQIEFAKLRHAYCTVKGFINSESYDKVKSLNTTIEGDLGLSGDDNYELLEKFVAKFELDYRNFDYSAHFYSEGELFGSGGALINLLNLSVWLPLKTIELLTLNKVKIDKKIFIHGDGREVADLTFRDLLTWYNEKEYKPSGSISYEIKN